jgi:capsular exopolysaccharide synthesis family protein
MGNLFRHYLLSVEGWLCLVLLWTAMDGAGAACLLMYNPGLTMYADTTPAFAQTIRASGQEPRVLLVVQSVRVQARTQRQDRVSRDTVSALPAGEARLARRQPVFVVPALFLPDVAIGAAAGVLLALVVALLLAWSRGRTGSVAQIRAVLGLEVVALVPRFSRRARRTELPLASAELYRPLCACFHEARQPVRLVTFTSAQVGEGTSTLVSDVAIHLARTGKRVLLVDLNMQHPAIARRFCLKSQAGLTDMLARYSRGLPLEQYCQASSFTDLYVLAAGTCPMNALELLHALTETQFFSRLHQTPFDYVLLDAPALCAGTEACTLAASGEALVLVVHGSRTSRRELAKTRQLLEQMRLTGPVGVILNQRRGRDQRCISLPRMASLALNPRLRIEAVTLELPVVAAKPCLFPEADDDYLPDTGKTVQIRRIPAEQIIRPPISLNGLMGTTNGLLGRASGMASATPVPSSLQELAEETHNERS